MKLNDFVVRVFWTRWLGCLTSASDLLSRPAGIIEATSQKQKVVSHPCFPAREACKRQQDSQRHDGRHLAAVTQRTLPTSLGRG